MAPQASPPLLASAQQQARNQLFVGRTQELADFEHLLAAAETPRIIHVHGPGGIGKSSLLYRFQDLAEQAGSGFARLDARLLPTAPESVRQEVDQALDDLGGETGQPAVIAIDHAEQWAALDGWLRTELLPSLPGDLILVVASRQPPTAEWRADPGISQFLSEWDLAPLAEAQTKDYLQRRGILPAQRDAIARFARGSPLALALAADQVLRSPQQQFHVDTSPDLFQTLAEWLLRDLDDQKHRQAVEACATVRRLDEPLLAAMLDKEDAPAEFEWLAKQHFVDQQANGLVIHDLIRDSVIQDLRRRDLDYHHTLVRRVATHLMQCLTNASAQDQIRMLTDSIYVIRHEPYAKRQFPFGDTVYFPDTIDDNEYETLGSVVEAVEGADSRYWFEYWLDHRFSELLVLRDRARNPKGLCLFLKFSAAEMETGQSDPGSEALLRHLREKAPLRGGEMAMLTRFFLTADKHQSRTPAFAELSAQMLGRLFTPGVSFFAFVADTAEDWSDPDEQVSPLLLPGSEFRIGGQEYKIGGHDLRREPPQEWVQNRVERAIIGGATPQLIPEPSVLLQERDFSNAVLGALHDFNDDAKLSDNALLQSPMLRRYATERSIETLRALIHETSAEKLGAGQAPGNAHEILDLVYFQPTAKLQAAAAELHISERTLRRRVRQAEQRLVDALWRLDTQMD